jgi:hypothetical protein
VNIKLDPTKRLRQHPDDPNVWEYDVVYIRAMFPNTPCRGCQNHHSETHCEDILMDRQCAITTVWYGEHIEIANKLEGV